jgi:hypothetical protein
MKVLQNKTLWIATALVVLMAMTRFNHFGSSVALPDASYAVFFLGGLFLGRVRAALAILALLLVEAALVDFYAINFAGVSGWCVTSAYGFLVFAYSALWYVGRWYAPRHDLSGKGMLGLFAAAVAAGSLAFVIANVSFYLLAGYFDSMSVGSDLHRLCCRCSDGIRPPDGQAGKQYQSRLMSYRHVSNVPEESSAQLGCVCAVTRLSTSGRFSRSSR